MIFSIDRPEPSRPALMEGAAGPTWTYGQLCAEVTRRAGALAAPGKQLAFLLCQNDLDAVAWYLAALEAGQPVALLAATLDAALLGELCARYRPERVVAAAPPSADYQAGVHPGLWSRRSAAPEAPPHDDLALLLSTSGSTGSPKLVRLTRKSVEANAASIAAALHIAATDVPVAHLPMHYSYGLSVLNSHLLCGAAILLTCDGLVAPGFWDMVRRRGVNSFSGVPYTYHLLRRLGLDRLKVPALTTMTQAGGKLDVDTIAHFHAALDARGGRFAVMYGQTEATARITVLPHADIPRRPGSVGRAIPGGRLSLAGPDDGELCYHGPNVMMGYATLRADLARGDELGGRLMTGDRARIDEDGYLYVLGRARRDAKVFGLRINLDEVEAMVRAHGAAAVVGGEDKLVVWCEFGDAAAHEALRDELCGRLRLHRSAFDFRRVDALPTRDSGKIDYPALAGRP